jgi:hypothetical protein
MAVIRLAVGGVAAFRILLSIEPQLAFLDLVTQVTLL